MKIKLAMTISLVVAFRVGIAGGAAAP